ncbi:hypothetical protein Bca4012_062214 [Brassica carinata]
MDADSGSSSEEQMTSNEYLNQWSKFDEALHEMLNDPSNPALFGKDAPPCSTTDVELKGTLTPNVRKLVEENYELSTGLAVRDIGELEFQVQDSSGECFTVLLAPGSCSCMEYDLIGIPCSHALPLQPGLDSFDALVARLTMFQHGKKDLLVRRPPGRPRKVRILSRGESKEIPPVGNANVVAVQAITVSC